MTVLYSFLMPFSNLTKIFALLFLMVFTTVNAQKYNLEKIPQLSSLDESFIYTINQDSKGYLWIGTSDGLFNYDGFNLQAFSTKDSLADNFITSSYITDKGVWFGHMNGKLSFFDGQTFSKHTVGENESSIANITQSPDGSIWAGTFTGGFINLTQKQSNAIHEFEKKDITLYAFCFISSTEILVGSYDGIRRCLITTDGKIKTIEYIRDIPSTKIQEIKKSNTKDCYYVATQNEGFYCLTNTKGNIKAHRMDRPEKNIEGVQGFIEDKKATLWIATFGHGLYKATINENNTFESLIDLKDTKSSFSENIKTLFQDRDENIWIGNYGNGIKKLSFRTFSLTTYTEDSLGSNIYSIEAGPNFKWIGTDKGLAKCDLANGQILKLYNSEQGLPNDIIKAIHAGNDGRIWIGTSNQGIWTFNPHTQEIKKYPIHFGNLENNITSIASLNNELWIGTKKGLCRVNLLNDSVEWYNIHKGGLPHNSVRHIFIDSKQNIWITTLSNTLLKYSNNSFRKINIPSESGINTLEIVTEDKNGDIWTGSAGQGIFRIHGDSIMNLTTSEGLFSNYCYSLAGDKNGFIWIGHRGGLSRVNVDGLSIRSIEKINHTDIKYDFNPKAIAISNNNKIWFGTNKGLITHNPEFENREFLPPLLNITSIQINNLEYEIKNKIKLSPGSYKIKLDYIGINLKDPSKVKYQHRLLGYDNEWSEIIKETSVTYPRLSEGIYIFELHASSAEGIVTKPPLRIQFIIKTPLYKRTWAYIVLAIIIGILVFGYFKRREYLHQYEKLQLERKVHQRTREINRQKVELEKQASLIKSKNNDITDSLKYARKLQSSISPPEEILTKLFPNHFLINKPKDIVSGDFCWYTEIDKQSIITVADCTGHGVPGAIMSILGITSLHEIINNQRIISPSRVLDLLRLKVITSLSQHSKESPSLDGMNLGLCVIDQKTLKIKFSGAINNLVHIQDNKMKVLRADRIPIGFSYHEDKQYTEQETQGQPGDMIYLFSDGFQDQFGGTLDKKYSRRQFHKTLYRIHKEDLHDQQFILEQTLTDWMGKAEQTDDITILGIRL